MSGFKDVSIWMVVSEDIVGGGGVFQTGHE